MANEELVKARKIFFLFVPTEFEKTIVKDIVVNEYEAYTLSDDTGLYLPILFHYPNSIVFAYENNCPRNVKWKEYYDKLSACCVEGEIKISTLRKEGNVLKIKEDLTNFTPPFPEITLEPDSKAAVPSFLEILSAFNARGRRSHVRIICDDGYSATFSVKVQKRIFTGTILDISSIGMACSFAEPLELAVKMVFEDIQLRLNGQVCQVSGTIYGKREINNTQIYVIMFDFRKFPDHRQRIYEYVYSALQRDLKKMKNHIESSKTNPK
ncbi:MAG TPA: PilZ domain-containing protein [Spirochaetota bacterium]